MWSSTLPTGTVREEGRGSQTFPKQPTPQLPQQVEQSSEEPVEENAALEAELNALREEHREAEAEIQRLESQVSMLRKQLANHKEGQAAMVDQYEHIISELEAAAATAPRESRSQTSERGSLRSRLKNWLF